MASQIQYFFNTLKPKYFMSTAHCVFSLCKVLASQKPLKPWICIVLYYIVIHNKQNPCFQSEGGLYSIAEEDMNT